MIWLVCFTAGILCINLGQCYGTESGEVNHGENVLNPRLYDTIVFNDIADIINELDNPTGNSLIEAFINSVESQSDENIEDLLLEYQHYLDKARKQRKSYLDKTKQLKNKVPPPRRDPYMKKKAPPITNYDPVYFANSIFSPREAKYPKTYYNPIEFLIPLDSRNRFFNDAQSSSLQSKADSKYDDSMYTLHKVLSKQRVFDSSPYHRFPPKEPNLPSCYCKTNVIPCECDCEQCIVPPDMINGNQNENRNKYNVDRELSELFNVDNIRDASDNSFNVQIKVDIQLPKPKIVKYKNRHLSQRADSSKEIQPSTTAHLPFSYFNFPIPMHMFGFNNGAKNSKIENTQSHKLMIHKKKKFRPSPNNKKHRKKIITFHTIKPDLRPKIEPIFEENLNKTETENIKDNETIALESKPINITDKEDISAISSHLANNITAITNVPNLANETQTEENINLNVKLMVLNDNVTENNSRFENNIDTGIEDVKVRGKSNTSDVAENLPSFRRKREVSVDDEDFEPDVVKTTKNNEKQETKKAHNLQKNNKARESESTKRISNFQKDQNKKHANPNKQGHVIKKSNNNNKGGQKNKKDGLRNGLRKSGSNKKTSKTRRFAIETPKTKGETIKKPDHLKANFQRNKKEKSTPYFKGVSKTKNHETPQAHNTEQSKLSNRLDEKFLEHDAKFPSKISKLETSNKAQTKTPSIVKKTGNMKNKSNPKNEKNILLDAQLLYWPSNDRKPLALGRMKKNITSLILEREHQKAKVNISVEVIRQNHTRALEKAVFGDVSWDDVDTIAPVFMSFVGKYIKGVLTMCSQTVCHSMNCGNKVCVHRVCIAKDRLNNGHCIGDNGTESDVSLESIMDLPSNIAFTVVDILQEKMLGKLFGKLTLCINSKCVTFATAKKIFLKTKCSTKDLHLGHCANA